MAGSDKPLRMQALRELLEQDLNSQLNDLRKRLWEGRTKARQGSLQQTHQLRVTRRQIARVQTVMKEKRNG